jgi:hypothetical protein
VQRATPFILVLLTLTPARTDWLSHTEEKLELRGCAYWLSLRGQAASPNKVSIRVRIPRTNQFTPAGLGQIMETIRRREPL